VWPHAATPAQSQFSFEWPGPAVMPPERDRRGRQRFRPGRVEAGLEREFRERPDVGPAARSSMRAQARAVDVAERAGDPDQVSTANRVYLDLRHAEGLGPPITPDEGDAFERLLAELGRPTAEPGHTPDA
jgi:hypothetical protein